MTNEILKRRDLVHIWHPCSQMKDYEHLPLIPIKKGEGIYLHDFDGNRYIDAISSWWVNLFGHANPRINDKIKTQLDTLEHVIFAGFTHESAVTLAERIVRITPPGLEKVFFADNGSAAIEVALKMSFHYHKNRGEIRPLFISLENSYHGETLGALSVGDVALYKETYQELLIHSVQAKSPALVPETEALEDMERLLKSHQGEISAVIIEPLIQCAGGMAMYDATYITALRALCDQYDVHLIADEIAVGFGRTGTLFACEQAQVTPDFLCLSKGLTAGYLPLALVVTTGKVYQQFYCDYETGQSFLHSHSYTGNPLACAAANATLDIFEEDDIIAKNKEKIAHLTKELKKFEGLPNVGDIRQQGYDPVKRMGLHIYRHALSNGVLLRPLGHVVYFMPPYTLTKEEITYVVDTALEAISALPDPQ